MGKTIKLALIGIFACFLTSAQEQSLEKNPINQEHIKKNYTIFFPVSVSDVRFDYKGNGATIETMMIDLEQTLMIDGTLPDSLTIYASTSPEGPKGLNERLAVERAENVRVILENKFPQFTADKVKVISKANDWSGMILVMRRDTSFKYRDQLLKILTDSKIANKDAELRTKYPQIFTSIRDLMFDNMRTASVTISVVRTLTNMDEFVEEPVVENKKDTIPTMIVEQRPLEIPEQTIKVIPEKEVDKPCRMSALLAVKTNLLYDVAIVPNIGLEIPIGENFSVVGNWMYSWWKNDKKAWYWRTYGGDIAARYWFGKASKKRSLSGHHVGIYGQMLTYDFIIDQSGILADEWNWVTGLEYGYSLPLGGSLNMDFTFGAGYHWGEFKEYIPIDGHYVWQATKKRRFIGPTKVEISLVWLLKESRDSKKGGKR